MSNKQAKQSPKPMAKLDLGGLDAFDVAAPASAAATPVRASLDMFYPDPDQPRQEFDPVSLQDFANQLREANGVQTVINVRPPGLDGRMMIIHGERRWRASAIAGFTDIPYLIQADAQNFDDYSQVAENVQRESLSPQELANFMQKRVNAGDSQTFIAKRLGLSKAAVTFHLGMLAAPDFVQNLYKNGKCRSAQYLYELGKLAKTYPAEVQQFCDAAPEVSKSTIQALTVSLASPRVVPEPSPSPAPSPAAEGQKEDQVVLNLNTSKGREGSKTDDDRSPDPIDPTDPLSASVRGDVPTSPAPGIGGDASGKDGNGKKAPMQADPTKIRKPMMLAKHGKEEVMLLLNRRPSVQGMVMVRYNESSAEAEVSFSSLKGLLLTEGAA